MNKIKNGILISLRKVKNLYKKAYNKTPYTEPIVGITLPLLLVLSIILTLNVVLDKDVAKISTDVAEESYYEANYEVAISENDKLQENDKWPIYKVKNAEIYSIQGDYNKSNDLLAKAVQQRDEYINTNGRDLYVVQDESLMNYVVFTYFMNGEYEQAITLGEDYLKKYGQSNQLMKTMFTVYLANNEKENAITIAEKYPVDNNSAYDLALYAHMNMLVNNWDVAIMQLEKAWELDKDEIKIMEVLEDITVINKKVVTEKFETLSASNKDAHKVWLAKVYSLDKEKSAKAKEILEVLDDETLLDTMNVKTIMVSIYENLSETEEAEKISKEIIDNDKNQYYAYHFAAEDALKNGEYDKAIELAKFSIMQSSRYAGNYVSVIPNSLIAKGDATSAHPYLRAGLRIEPFSYDTLIKIGDVYSLTGNYKAAQKMYALGLNIDKTNSKLYVNLAKFYKEDGNLEEAVNVMQKAVDLEPKNIDYLRILGGIQMEAKQNDEAISNIRKAYSINNEDPLVLSNAAVYYFTVENDFERGMINMEAAYKKSDLIKDLEVQKELLSNYNWAKEAYDKYKAYGTASKIPEFTIFN